MKKLFLLSLATAIVASASAEGYQVNTLSAKQLGMGHVGVSQSLGSESLWFNPGAAVQQEQKFTISAGVTGIAAVATRSSMNDYQNSILTETSDNDLSTPLYFNANYKINNRLSVGVLLNTPFGSSMNWGDNWTGAHLVQSISLQAYNAQPTVSYSFFKGKLSVGAGLMMTWGNFSLSRSLFPVGDETNAIIAALAGDYGDYVMAAEENPLASATLSGDAGLRLGYNAGVLYNVNDKWSIGASYRSKINMKVGSGTAEVDYYNEIVESILSSSFSGMEVGTFTASLPLPATLSAGVTFCPNERWTLSTEFQWVQWSAYDSLAVTFNEEYLGAYNQVAVKNYSNTTITRLGAQYLVGSWLTVRAGFYVDESPVASDYLNPETPSMTKVGYTCGASLRPFGNKLISIDLAYAYVDSADPERAGSYPYSNSLTGAMEPYSGNYIATANTFSFGVSFAL